MEYKYNDKKSPVWPEWAAEAVKQFKYFLSRNYQGEELN